MRQTARGRSDGFADKLYHDDDFDVVDGLLDLARARQLPPAQLALAWLLHKPGVTAPVIGTTCVAHLDDAIAALDVRLAESEIRALEACYKPHPVRGLG